MPLHALPSTGCLTLPSASALLADRLLPKIEPGAHNRLASSSVLTNAMHIRVAWSAKCNQVLLGIIAGLAAQLFVVNF
jgi:hypothetical protein